MESFIGKKKTLIRAELGKNIKIRRISVDLTQEQLAEKANVSATYLGSIERGERNLGIDILMRLAKALGCSAKDLLPRDL